jgi:hypothetical protein
MYPDQVKALCELTKTSLNDAIKRLEQFLNSITLQELLQDNETDMQEFYQGYLSDLRQLLVFSEVYYEKLGTQLRRPTFNVEQAERVLYDTYHQCVNRFYYPKNECYSEEGRYAYTGQDAIRFRKKPGRIARDIVMDCSLIYEQLREQLGYYETEYVNQRRLQGERV